MALKDKRIDSYILRAEDFAIPVLEHLRDVVHEACPQVRETIKWSFPHFEYKDSILCSMASFKAHCAFGFWLGSKLSDPEGILETRERTAMGHLGRITSVKDLPSRRTMKRYIREAMSLIDKGTRLEKKVAKAPAGKSVEVPPYLREALKKDPAALSAFNKFSHSKKKDYVEWLTEARTQGTRDKRLAMALTWIAEGKSRHWKYER